MKKAYRVKKEREFQAIIQQQNSCANRNLVLFILDKPGQRHFRYGISVGKKIGNAVMRNRVKRQIREGIFQIKEELRSDVDFILIARPNIKSLSTMEVKENLRHVCKLGKIINKEEG